jgi:hypothetical protein
MLDQWFSAGHAIQDQIHLGNPIWLQSFVTGIGKTVEHFLKSIKLAETTGHVRKPTYARNREEVRSSCHQIGYQNRTEGN